MTHPYRYIEVERRGEVFCVTLCHPHLDELMVHELASELRCLIEDDGCRKLALSLGPQAPECLYSVFLAQLISLQRELRQHQGELVLCHATPPVREIFVACGLDQLFYFVPDFDEAVAHWTKNLTAENAESAEKNL
jgi:anti-anti-sigma factor